MAERNQSNARAVDQYYQDLKDGKDRSTWAAANAHILKLYPGKEAIYEAWLIEQSVEEEGLSDFGEGVLPIGPLRGEGPTPETLRWPKDIDVRNETDYVFFQFGSYIPPFGSVEDTVTSDVYRNEVYVAAKEDNRTQNAMYEMSSYLKANGPGVILPMPQDLGNETETNWQGKSFTQIGRAAISGASGNSGFAVGKLKKGVGNVTAIMTAVTAAGLNVIPGLGGNLSMNDISGSTKGIVLNPNAELLFDSPTLREIGMTWKLIARNQKEAQEIQKIIKLFRESSLPRRGSNTEGGFTFTNKDLEHFGNKIQETLTPFDNGGNLSGGDLHKGETFIHVPDLCRFSFMTGSEVNRKIIQFKPCAVNRVTVNYTPDGTYATYSDGSPVAIELGLSFLETKIVFKDDVSKGY